MSEVHAFQKIETLLNTKQLASLGPEPRTSREPIKLLEKKLVAIFSETKVSQSTQPLIRSLVLLWHDHLDESHSISQDIHSADGSFLHGIMHRREPDYGNAKYWFHRVGQHPAYPSIASSAVELLSNSALAELKSKLVGDGQWDAFAFVDACESALRKNDSATIPLLEQLQEIEFKSLLRHFFR